MKRSYSPTILLYCFSDAGGSALVFRDWQSAFPDNIRVRPVELPGRGMRMHAPLIHDYRSLILTLTREIAEDIANMRRQGGDVLYAGFGHGAGAAFNFAVCSRLSQRLQQAPAHCFLSGGLPFHADRKKLSTLGDPELSEEMRVRLGTQHAAAGQAEMLNFYLPIFRADCAVHEQSVLDRERRLDCPLTVFTAGLDQRASAEAVPDWNRYTGYATRNVLLSGDHVSALHAPEEMIGHIRDTIDYSRFRQSGLLA
jgi:medium-chain acyl-[acyl-carrier-protein] hydrolase